MAKLVFDAAGSHKFETGISDCVLYVADSNSTHTLKYGSGVAWNGLVSVSESPEGAEANDIYADNIKYLSLISAENFKASIEAYTYPDEFEECDGSVELKYTPSGGTETSLGMYITQQTRKQFCLCYKTKVGNDQNPEAGYKLHIIYNATAAPSERAYQTVNDSPEAMTFSWELSTIPMTDNLPDGFNLKSCSHLVIDSSKIPSGKEQDLLDALYGTNGASPAQGTNPYIPSPQEIYNILKPSTQVTNNG